MVIKRVPLHVNIYFLLTAIACAIIYTFSPHVAAKIVCVFFEITFFLLALLPSLIRTTLDILKIWWLFPKNVMDSVYNFFSFKFKLDLRKDELSSSVDDLCRSMEIKGKVGLNIVPNSKDAWAQPNMINFGEPLLEILDPDEILYVLAHELAHIKRNHPIKQIFTLMFISMLLIILLAVLSRFSPIHFFSNLSAALFIGLCAISLRFFTWPREYKADTIAVQYVKKGALESALKKIAVSKNMSITWNYYTHPCVSNRILNLGWDSKTRFKKWYFCLT